MIDEPGAQAANPTPTLTDADMPPLFHHADQRSIKAQKRFFSWLWWEAHCGGKAGTHRWQY